VSGESERPTARAFFDGLWCQDDFWQLESSPFERARHEGQLALIRDRRYARALEIGCGAGAFTRQLAPLCDSLVALDVSPVAVERARAALAEVPGTEVHAGDIMEWDLRDEPPWDLIVVGETIYYVGWLHSFFEIGWLAGELHLATAPSGRLLLSNTVGGVDEELLAPWIIRTYRDLFLNTGYELEREETFHGTKDGVELEVLTTLFRKPE
jgi:SAM-dependent methyltransferase